MNSNNNADYFVTDSLPLSAWLLCTRKLKFIRCEERGRRMAFLFDDGERIGNQLTSDFISGAECSALGFYDSMRTLRKIMTSLQKENENVYQSYR